MGRKKKEDIIETNVIENEVIENSIEISEVEEVKEVVESEPAVTTKRTMTVINCGALRVRKEPNLKSEVIRTVGLNEVVEVLDEDENWVTTKDGYMLKEFLQ